jgi:hypothetical protein
MSKDSDPITFAGVTLTPFRYAERRDEDGLSIDLQATLTQQETDALRKLLAQPREYFDVQRADSDEPVRMRLGRVVWHQDAGAETVEHQITLVSEEFDANSTPFPMAHDPEVRRLMETVASLRGGMHVLLEAMKAGEPMDADLAASVRAASQASAADDLWLFHEVDDIAVHWFHDD